MSPKTVKIDKMIHSGFGLVRQESGQVMLVHRALPGEEIIPEIIDRKKQFVTAYPKTIVKAHEQRIDPGCPTYNQCGGCNFQHADYSLQLQLKHNILVDLASRFSTSSEQIIPLIRQPLPSPRKTNYRQRIRLQVGNDNSLGFYRHRTHRICPIHNCLLAENRLNEVLTALQENKDAQKLLAHSRELELLFHPDDDLVFALFHYARKIRPADKSAAIRLTGSIQRLDAIFFQGSDYPISAPFSSKDTTTTRTLSFTIAPSGPINRKLTLSWEPGGFSQVNLDQNRQLIDLVLRSCAPEKDDRILDLFCGMGNFSLPLALSGYRVTGVDSQRSAIRSAKRNLAGAQLDNCPFTRSSVDRFCHQLVEHEQQFDTVILDPPRQGIPNLTKTVSSLARKKIIYISCDPATLFRDLGQLINAGFIPHIIQPIDMFPQTHHIETIVVLERVTHH